MMKKLLIIVSIILTVLLLLSLLLILIYGVYLHVGYQTTKVEIYEGEEEYLIIRYRKNGGIYYTIDNKVNGSKHSCGADFVSDNTAVFDGSYAFPESSEYHEFVFYDEYVEFYDNGEFICKYDLIVEVLNID